MNNLRPPLNDQIHDIFGNRELDKLMDDYSHELRSIERDKDHQIITTDEYEARKESAGQQAEQVIYELWREATGNE